MKDEHLARLETLRIAQEVVEALNKELHGDEPYNAGDILTIAESFWNFVSDDELIGERRSAGPEGELN